MKSVNLNKNWRMYKISALSEDDAENFDLPIDVLTSLPRNYEADGGAHNSYYDSAARDFVKVLPALKKSRHIYIELDGVCGVCDIYINDVRVTTVTTRYSLVEITDYYAYASRNILKLNLKNEPFSKSYTGLGISCGVNLVTEESDICIEPYGVNVVTRTLNDRAELSVFASIKNETSEKQLIILQAEIFNMKNRRVSRKIKKIKLKANSQKEFEIPVRFTRHYDWCAADAYKYSALVSLTVADKLVDSQSCRFGIKKCEMTQRGLSFNDKLFKLKGAVMTHDNGILGMVSTPSSEKFKLSKIKDMGYNAVRYIGCPSEAVLDTLDDMGLMLVADIFDSWTQGAPSAYTALFETSYEKIIEDTVKKLRNHPCLALYSLGNNVTESYGRNDGYSLIENIASLVKSFDPYHLTCVNAAELVPTRQEMEKAGGKISKIMEGDFVSFNSAAINFAREKDMFKNNTMEFFKFVDVAGYSLLHPRFALDKMLTGRNIISLAAESRKAFDNLEEVEKDSNVIGDFYITGTDFLGTNLGKPQLMEPLTEIMKARSSFCGDLDLTYNRKPISHYKEILLGNRNKSFIVVRDPEAKPTLQQAKDFSLAPVKALWNWPRFVSQPITVEVYTGGDIVALYLDGNLIGRKLAGKVNKYVATFNTSYFPGKLEAVSFHRGHECSRCELMSVSAPRAIKMECSSKVISGDLCFIDIIIVDKENRHVPFANREIEVTVTGGELVMLSSANPYEENIIGAKRVNVYEGRALCVVRGKDTGKMSVKATCEGLLSCKATIRVKESDSAKD